jgi:hypothetical protein
MTTGVEAPDCGLLHEAAVYEGDEQFLAVAVAFLQGGLDAGEPTVGRSTTAVSIWSDRR